MKSTKEIAKQFKKHKTQSQARLRKQYGNTKKCQAFYAGDFMSYQDNIDAPNGRGNKNNKVLVKFNKVKPYVNAVKGFMAQNRRRPKYEARLENDKLQELFSGYANAINGYCRDNADADQVETQQDGDLLTNGYGAIETALTYGEGYASSEADGEILMGRLDPLAVGWDPHAKATNLLDARWVYYSKEYELETAKMLFSNTDAEDYEAADGEREDDGYEYFPYGGNYDKIAPLEYTNEEENTVKVYFYQWYEIEPFYKALNPLYEIDDQQTMQAVDAFLQMLQKEYEDVDDSFDPRDKILVFGKEIKAELEEYFDDMLGELFPFNKKVYYTAVVSGESVFTAYRSISQQGYTIQFKTGDYDASNGIWMGMVNSMMEPALYYNKALSELMFTIAANSKGGVIAERSAIDDIREFERTYNKTDGITYVEDGALQSGAVQEKARAQLPTGLNDIVNLSDAAITAVNGFDATFMGSREFANDTAAFQKQRIRQATSLLACYFDAASLYQKRQARIMLGLMRVFVENNEGMSVRIIGEEGQAMFLELATKQLSAEYDVVIGEAPLTVQDKQEQADILIAMGDKVAMTDPGAAKVIYAVAIDIMPLELAMKEKIREKLVPEDQPVDPQYVKQLEQTVQQLQDEGRKAQLQKTMAGAQLDIARAEETRAKAATQGAERDKKVAEVTETLESARNQALENDIVRTGSYNEANVNI